MSGWTVPWLGALLFAVPPVAAVVVGIVEKRDRRRDGYGWKGPGW